MEKLNLKKIGYNIKLKRLSKKLTQQQLAEKCKFAVKTISLIETNKSVPTLQNLATISVALDCAIEELLY